MALEITKLTMGEIALIESLSKQSIAQIEDDTAPKGEALAALAMVATRRAGNPSFTWNDALGLTFEEAMQAIGAPLDAQDAEADPFALEASTPDAAPAQSKTPKASSTSA